MSDDENPIPMNTNHLGGDVAEADNAAGLSSSLCTIYLTSHGHRYGPYSPTVLSDDSTPRRILRYDLRNFPNPPKSVRAQQTGLNKTLLEWFFSSTEVSEKFEEVCADIEAELSGLVQDSTGGGELHVVVFCEMGRHRSVAFVEKLGQKDFFVPDTRDGKEKCRVMVQHRDLARSKKERSSGNRRKRAPHQEL